MNNKERVGHITSSKIYLLLANGRSKSPITSNTWSKPALTYFQQKRIERKLGKCIDTNGYSRPMAWGNFMEYVVFSHLGLEYKIVSQQSEEHHDPEFKDIWSGSKDLFVPNVKIGEIKCYQLEKFCLYTDAITAPITKTFTFDDKLENLRTNFTQEYYQMVSNAIINKVNKAEAITFAPFESELEDIRDLVRNYEGPDKWKYRFIEEEDPDNLPVLKDGGHYNNLNIFEFTVPEQDKQLLTEKVRLAKSEIIVDNPTKTKQVL